LQTAGGKPDGTFLPKSAFAAPNPTSPQFLTDQASKVGPSINGSASVLGVCRQSKTTLTSRVNAVMSCKPRSKSTIITGNREARSRALYVPGDISAEQRALVLGGQNFLKTIQLQNNTAFQHRSLLLTHTHGPRSPHLLNQLL